MHYGNTSMSLTIKNIKPISTNHMYYSFVRKGGKGTFKTKTSDYVEYIKKIHLVLDRLFVEYPEVIDLVKGIKEFNCPGIEVVVTIPKEDYMTKDGRLKSNDTSNFIKTVEDAMFSYFSQKISEEINDKQVLTVYAEKKMGEVWSMDIRLYFRKLGYDDYNIRHSFDPIVKKPRRKKNETNQEN